MVLPSKTTEKEVVIKGIRRLILVPEKNPDILLSEAIFIDAYDTLTPYLDLLPHETRTHLWEALWDRGLIKVSDFLTPSARAKVAQALKQAIKYDLLRITTLIDQHVKEKSI
jgi:hypothetical protein